MIPLGQAYGASREATAFGKEILFTALLSNTLIVEDYLEDFAELFGVGDTDVDDPQ